MKKIILTLILFCSILFSQERYSRDKFGEGWNNYRGCISVREHVLISKSQEMVVMDSKNCNIEKGKWFSIWENRYFDEPEKIDIDHTVPLKWAYVHGANKWTDQQRNEFANNYTDEYHLVPLSVYNNRSKGSKGPDRWLPPHNRCLYIKVFIEIVNKHKLEFNSEEKNKIEEIQKKECK